MLLFALGFNSSAIIIGAEVRPKATATGAIGNDCGMPIPKDCTSGRPTATANVMDEEGMWMKCDDRAVKSPGRSAVDDDEIN
jgi:hypothetical protein